MSRNPIPERLRRSRHRELVGPSWQTGDGIVVHTYDAKVVKSWIRGFLDVRSSQSQDPEQQRFDAELDTFMSCWLAGSDEDIAMGVAVGRRIERQMGEDPLQIVRADDDCADEDGAP